MITLLNTSILTSFGQYQYSPATIESARRLLADAPGWQSAIGHESTAAILSRLLDIDVPVNRIQYQQGVGDVAIVFKLRGRPPESAVLTVEQLEEIGYDFGVLRRLS